MPKTRTTPEINRPPQGGAVNTTGVIGGVGGGFPQPGTVTHTSANTVSGGIHTHRLDSDLDDMRLNATILREDGDEYPTVFPATADGLTSALAAASSGDAVDLATATYTDAVTIGAGVTVRGRGGTTITGTVTLGDGSVMIGVDVAVTGASTTVLTGVLGPESGTGYLYRCTIAVTNTGGTAYGAVAQAGDVDLRECHGAVTGTAGYAVATSGAGDIDVYDGGMVGSTDNAIVGVTL